MKKPEAVKLYGRLMTSEWGESAEFVGCCLSEFIYSSDKVKAIYPDAPTAKFEKLKGAKDVNDDDAEYEILNPPPGLIRPVSKLIFQFTDIILAI